MHWRSKKKIVKDLIRENKVKKNSVELINNKFSFLFYESIEIYSILTETIRLAVLNTNDSII